MATGCTCHVEDDAQTSENTKTAPAS